MTYPKTKKNIDIENMFDFQKLKLKRTYLVVIFKNQ
jgi:hypothetical protein